MSRLSSCGSQSLIIPLSSPKITLSAAGDIRSKVCGLCVQFLRRKAHVDPDSFFVSFLGQFDATVVVGASRRKADARHFGPFLVTQFRRNRTVGIG